MDRNYFLAWHKSFVWHLIVRVIEKMPEALAAFLGKWLYITLLFATLVHRFLNSTISMHFASLLCFYLRPFSIIVCVCVSHQLTVNVCYISVK